MRLYSDLDHVLVFPIVDERTSEVVDIVVRPDADWFIRKLASRGDLWLLTAASREHALRSLRRIGPAARLFRGILSYEDLAPIEDQLELILASRSLSERERQMLWNTVRPIAPPGIVFDDFPPRSGMFALKATAVGIGPESWIEVTPFDPERRERGALRKAYREFERRVGARSFLGRRVLACR